MIFLLCSGCCFAEVEEGEEEDRQEEGWEVESGVQGEEDTPWMAMMMVMSEVLVAETLCVHVRTQWNCLWMCTL